MWSRIMAATAMMAGGATATLAEPLYPNSVVSNELEFITTSDENAFGCLIFQDRVRAEMPDKRRDELFADGVFLFQARFTDGTQVDIYVHPDAGEMQRAEELANAISRPIGALPTLMRQNLRHVVVHIGDETAFAEDRGRFFTVYSENMATRIENHDLEETVFHESVHATLDVPWADSAEWRQAQRADGGFITDYAARNRQGEDLAESALFAWALLRYPGRLPAEVEEAVRTTIPNRLELLEQILEVDAPIQRPIGSYQGCNG
ncbi:hypothetical protein J7426_02535 [Tropicibacter sp. R16_0]|uniref:hypothetical protein n=1 Tax=Tropicibacter sp. R16_0 TaxID=2821102 RepID=UPI001ADB10C5|nr:hypothetical protein [Tropicibacter sp. R16_0]MBO9449117.1 hypothetical protein [Tropicibacter sp. R16_0]